MSSIMGVLGKLRKQDSSYPNRSGDEGNQESSKHQQISTHFDKIGLLQAKRFGKIHQAWRPVPKSIPLVDAHKELSNFNHLRRPLSVAQHEARVRLLSIFMAHSPTVEPGALLTAFNDLDKLQFDGVLRHRVHVHWVHREDGPWAGECRPARNITNLSARVRIDINAAQTSHAGRPDEYLYAWGMLIHEMLHAHLEIVTGGRVRETCICTAKVFHGPMYGTATQALTQRLVSPGLRARHIWNCRGLCHRWNGRLEFLWNRVMNRAGKDEYENVSVMGRLDDISRLSVKPSLGKVVLLDMSDIDGEALTSTTRAEIAQEQQYDMRTSWHVKRNPLASNGKAYRSLTQADNLMLSWLSRS